MSSLAVSPSVPASSPTSPQSSLSQSTSQTLEDLVLQREKDIEILKHQHAHAKYWGEIALIGREEINFGVPASANTAQNLAKRAEQFYLLGLGFAAMLSQDNGPDAVRAAAQLLEEFEYFIASSTVQSMKAIRAKNVEDRPNRAGVKDPVRPTLYKSGKSITFEFLEVMHVPFALDYALIVCSLFDILKFVYNKFLDPDCQTDFFSEAIFKVDEKIRELVIRPIATDLRKNAVALAEFEIDELIKENESPGSKHKKTHKSLIPEQQQQQE